MTLSSISHWDSIESVPDQILHAIRSSYRVGVFIAGTPEGNLVVGYSNSPEILLFSSEGRKIGGFTLPIQRPTITPEQKNEAVQRISRSLDSLAADKKASPDQIERAREELEDYPTALPYYSNLLTDGKGNILVFLTDPLNSANVHFMAFSQSGSALGTCRFILPQGVSLRIEGRKQMAIHGGWLYALVHKNISGKEQVQVRVDVRIQLRRGSEGLIPQRPTSSRASRPLS